MTDAELLGRKIAQVTADGGRVPQPKDGIYIMEFLLAKLAQNPKKLTQTMIVEFRVVESDNDDQAPGDEVAYVNGTAYGLPNIKALVLNLSGFATEGEFEEYCANLPEPVDPDEQFTELYVDMLAENSSFVGKQVGAMVKYRTKPTGEVSDFASWYFSTVISDEIPEEQEEYAEGEEEVYEEEEGPPEEG